MRETPVSQAYQGITDIAFSGLKGKHPAPKSMSEPSARALAPSLALSVAPTVPLWNSFALFASGTAFGFWDLCGMEFCILKVLPTRFAPTSDVPIAENDSEIAPHKQGNKPQR